MPLFSNVTAPSAHRVFDSYALPLARPSEGSAAALSVVAHVAIAIVGVWGGAGLIEGRGAGGERRPAIDWVALPAINWQHAETPPLDPLKLGVRPPVVTTALTVPPPGSIRASLPAPLAGPLRSLPGLPAPVVLEEGASGDFGKGPSCGAVTKVRASRGADPGPESGTSARDVFRPTPLHVATTTAGAPPDDQREHDVQFWIRADGRVTKIAVSPPIRDSDYRRRFREAVSTFVFGPVQAPDGRPIDYVYRCVVYP